MIAVVIVELAPVEVKTIVIAEAIRALRADKLERPLEHLVLDLFGLR